MSKKNLFISDIFPPDVGGSSNMFAGRLSFYSPENLCVLTSVKAKSAQFDTAQQYTIVRKKFRKKGISGFEWLTTVFDMFFAAVPILLTRRIDCIECARPFPEGVAGVALSFLFRKKLVVNYHGEELSVLGQYRIEKKVLQIVIRYANLNLVNSQFTKSLLLKIGQSKNISVVNPGFDEMYLKNETQVLPEHLKKYFTSSPVILTVGRLQKRKGQDSVIKALPLLIKKHPSLHYLIVGSKQGGDPGFTEELYSLIQLHNLEKNVSIVGEVDQTELPLFFRNSDIFIMANRNENNDREGFGIVFLEAGYCRMPVIGGNDGGPAEAIVDGETGFVVDGCSVDDIAEKIDKLLSDASLRDVMGEKGFQHASGMTHRYAFGAYEPLISKL